eukprot:Pgem_evm1s4446
MQVLSILFCLVTTGIHAAVDDFPVKIPGGVPSLPQLQIPLQTSQYPAMPGNLFDDSQIIRIDFTTKTEPGSDPKDPKKYVKGNIKIQTTTNNITMEDASIRLTGGDSMKLPIKNYYFKAKKGGDDFFGEWDRFSIKKSMFDYSMCREKIASDIAIALGYYPRYVSYASVTHNGKYLGIYFVMQRMRKQWIKRTFGPDDKKKLGSQYKSDSGTMESINDNTPIDEDGMFGNGIFDTELSNKLQNQDENGNYVPGTDLKHFAKTMKTLRKIPDDDYTEEHKQTARDLVDYEFFVKAHVLDFYSGDTDGYFIGNEHNFEWYHDIEDSNKWKLLRWDFDSGFALGPQHPDYIYTLAKTPTLVLSVLLRDEQYLALYEKLLLETATKILPPYQGTGPKPAYFIRYEKYFNMTVLNDIIDRDPNNQEAKTSEELGAEWGMLGQISARSQQAIDLL